MAELQNTPTPHIGAKQGEIAETILLPGDPLRAKYIAEHFLTDAKQFNTTRNMYGYTGYYQGKRVSVMGTGMGCPSMGIYSYELIHFYGCRNLIRIGTAGALRPEVKVRELIFAMGSCTTSNYVKQFRLPGDYSCVCSYELLEKAVESAIERTISEALLVNPRTEYVRQFEFVWNGDAVSVSFVVKGVDIDEFKVSI